jgi:nitronate monooxygenase
MAKLEWRFMTGIAERVTNFCERYGLRIPILLAPLAGVPAPALSMAIAEAGGLGACGALLLQPAEILAWSQQVRARVGDAYQLNLWIPDPPAARDLGREAAVRSFLAQWGPEVPPEAAEIALPSFLAQCDAIIEAKPRAASSIMGLFPSDVAARLRRAGIAWFATVSTVTEAKLAEAAGADVIVAQGAEAGGHRANFEVSEAETQQVGLFALVPAVADAVRLPVVATGGIAEPRGVAAALQLGASAVAIGTAFLRTPEAGIHRAWADALSVTLPEQTVVSRAFSGRAGRSIATDYVRAAMAPTAPPPAAYPIQRGLTTPMRTAASLSGDVQRMQAWAGQSAAFARAEPAGALARSLWDGTKHMLSLS